MPQKECGAVFSLERTLKKHLQLHKEEKLGMLRALPGAAAAAATVSEEASWRSSTHEETAAFEAADEEWWGDMGDLGSSEEEYQAQASRRDNSASLTSWITAAVDRTAKTKRGRKKPAPAASEALGRQEVSPILTL